VEAVRGTATPRAAATRRAGGGSGGGVVSDGGVVHLSGAVAKGPLVLGSQVDVSTVDSAGNPTGTVYQTMTTTNAGEFALDVPPVASR
jgi:hypothetical protein